MKHSSVTSKGQVTIPAAVRQKLNLSTGSRVEFIPVDDYAIVVPINKSIKDLQGILPKPSKALTCEEIDNVIRGYK